MRSGSFAREIEPYKRVLPPGGNAVISLHVALHALCVFSVRRGSDGFVFESHTVFLRVTSQAPIRSAI